MNLYSNYNSHLGNSLYKYISKTVRYKALIKTNNISVLYLNKIVSQPLSLKIEAFRNYCKYNQTDLYGELKLVTNWTSNYRLKS